MRVIALNVWGRRGNWAARRTVLSEGLRQLRPDFISFQEAVVNGGYDQVTDLLGPEYHMEDRDWPFRRIDYVFVRCGEHGGASLPIADCQLIFDQPSDGEWASDHYGVTADLELPQRR